VNPLCAPFLTVHEHLGLCLCIFCLQTGVQADVPAGVQVVPAGVQVGVQVGVPAGVPAGVQVGVPAGVQVGVQVGVLAGVQVGVHGDGCAILCAHRRPDV
jgi:hypothetical protein